MSRPKVPKQHVTNRKGKAVVYRVIASVEIEAEGVHELRLHESGGRQRFGKLLMALDDERFKENAGSFKAVPWNVVTDRK